MACEFNTAPYNFHEISEKEFAQSDFFRYTPTKRDYRQILSKDSPCLSVILYHMSDNTGYGLSSDYWSGKVRYFKFGCEHDYRGISPEECRNRGIYHASKCYSVSECKKCGYINSVDSSD